MTRLAEMFNVNHFIVSQVNPHVVPFLIKEEDAAAEDAQQSTSSFAAGPSWIHSMTHLAKGEALHRLHVMVEMGIFPNALTKAVSVLSQKYSGDITILPEISYADFPHILSNPSPEFMAQATLSGERATWPKLSRVRNHCAIELALDEAVQNLRTRAVFSSSQIDLRLGAYSVTNGVSGKHGYRGHGRSGRGRRKLSQNSELDSSTAKTFREGRASQLKDSNHQKAYSINFLPSNQRYSMDSAHENVPVRVSPIEPLNISTSSVTRQDDILSSGIDTSNFSTDDSDTDISSTESPTSTSCAVLPDLWPTTRPLFPYASQPATPGSERRRSAAWSPSEVPNLSPSASIKSLAMTPANPPPAVVEPSSPELRYKRLFHGAKSRFKGSELKVSSEPGVKRLNAMGLQLDISGTRGMVLRKKRAA